MFLKKNLFFSSTVFYVFVREAVSVNALLLSSLIVVTNSIKIRFISVTIQLFAGLLSPRVIFAIFHLPIVHPILNSSEQVVFKKDYLRHLSLPSIKFARWQRDERGETRSDKNIKGVGGNIFLYTISLRHQLFLNFVVLCTSTHCVLKTYLQTFRKFHATGLKSCLCKVYKPKAVKDIGRKLSIPWERDWSRPVVLCWVHPVF